MTEVGSDMFRLVLSHGGRFDRSGADSFSGEGIRRGKNTSSTGVACTYVA